MKEIALLLIVFTANACLADDSACYGKPDNSHVPHPGDCNQFYVCHQGKATAQYCLNNLHFSPIRFFCQDPAIAECNGNPPISSSTSTTRLPTPSPTRCVGQPLGTLIRHADCNKYIVCIGGGVDRPCPTGLHFNERLKVCDWPERAKCTPML